MLDAPVTYNGTDLNTIEMMGNGVRRGCMLEEFDYGRAQGMGYTEKRSQDDGLDASDVFLGARYINLTGTVYGENPGDTFDRLQAVRSALTPTVAYDVGQPDYGYIPLQFSMPTNDTAFESPGSPGVYVKELEFRARPVGQPQFSIRRDMGALPGGGMQGDSSLGEKGGAIQWRATLECKDPRMYVRPDIWVPFTTPQTGVPIYNRGDYPAPLNVLLGVTSSSANSGIEIDVGGSTLKIALPSLANAVVRYSGELKVLTVDTGGIDTLRMDLLTLGTNQQHPKVMPTSPTHSEVYNIRFTGTAPVLAAGTRLMYSESFA
jgi:hypothetical protein